ncbi:hypothetical protein Tco_0789902 [Tanacetum coccineum]
MRTVLKFIRLKGVWMTLIGFGHEVHSDWWWFMADVTSLEDKDREKTNKMEKIEKRLEALKTNYALVSISFFVWNLFVVVIRIDSEAIEEYEKTRANPGNAGGSGAANTGGIVAPDVQGYGAIDLKISKCAEDDKVKFNVCTFEGRALTWWNRNV